MFNWKKKDKEIFGEMASSLLISGMIGGNPFIVIASLVTMARAYSLHKKNNFLFYLVQPETYWPLQRRKQDQWRSL